MTTITNKKQLPDRPLRMWTVKDQTEAAKVAQGRAAWLIVDAMKVIYVYVESEGMK